MNLLQDIFRILHQPVQLLIAALMFAYKEPKRKFWLIRAVLAAILGFLVLKLCMTASPEIFLNNFLASLVWSIGSFLILLSIEYSMFYVELNCLSIGNTGKGNIIRSAQQALFGQYRVQNFVSCLNDRVIYRY